MQHSLKAQDWANLNRYKKANASIANSSSENRVVFMGNSITEGWQNEKLSLFKNPNYINRGIGGQTTPQMLLRFQQDVIDLKPIVVVILAGINDIAQNTGYISIADTAKNIEEMTVMAKNNGSKVIISSVLPANYFPWRPAIVPTQKVIELNRLLKEIANKQQVTYLDYYTEMVNDQLGMKAAYTTDGVHCTLEGYKCLEQLLLPVLEGLF